MALNRETLMRALGIGLIAGALVWAGIVVWAAYTTDDWDYLSRAVPSLIAMVVGWRYRFPSQPPPLEVAPDEALMLQATDQARREIDRFLSGLQEGRRDPFVKYAIDTEDGTVEHVWAVAHSLDGKTLVTSLLDEPVRGFVIDSARQKIPLSDIEDWMLVDMNGRIEGGYTQIAMAKIYRRDKGYVPLVIRKTLINFDSAEPWLL